MIRETPGGNSTSGPIPNGLTSVSCKKFGRVDEIGVTMGVRGCINTGAAGDSNLGLHVACARASLPSETLRKTTHCGPPAPAGGAGTVSLAKRRYMTPTKAATTATARAAARI